MVSRDCCSYTLTQKEAVKRFSLCSTDYTRDYTNRKTLPRTWHHGPAGRRAHIHRHIEKHKVRAAGRKFDPRDP